MFSRLFNNITCSTQIFKTLTKGKYAFFIGVMALGFHFSTFSGAKSAERPLHIAAAANFAAPLKSLIQTFETYHGLNVILSTGSTGKLYAQIRNGAPFHIFLSADQERAALLEKNGLILPNQRFTYALGKLVLFSALRQETAVSRHSLYDPALSHLALANPKTAPYGAAARQVLETLKLNGGNHIKYVRGENIGQTYQFVASGNVKLGFVALSQVLNHPKEQFWVIPQNLYPPIYQDAVLLKTATNHKTAHAFFTFLQSPKARKIIQNHGYGTID